MANLAVAIGGCIGACLRFLLSEWIGTVHGFPVATLLINCVGSFVLSWLYTISQGRIRIDPNLRIGLGTGLIGAFTTYSTFGVETWQLVRADAVGALFVQGMAFHLVRYSVGEYFA